MPNQIPLEFLEDILCPQFKTRLRAQTRKRLEKEKGPISPLSQHVCGTATCSSMTLIWLWTIFFVCFRSTFGKIGFLLWWRGWCKWAFPCLPGKGLVSAAVGVNDRLSLLATHVTDQRRPGVPSMTSYVYVPVERWRHLLVIHFINTPWCYSCSHSWQSQSQPVPTQYFNAKLAAFATFISVRWRSATS